MKASLPVDWNVVEEGGDLAFRWGYSGQDLVAEWIGILTIRASKTGALRALQPAPGAPDDLVEKTRLGVAEAFLRSRRQQHSFHASAAAFRGRAIVCVGASGQGKSTLAERMCRHPGVELLADDTAGVEVLPDGTLQVPPSESAVWLIDQRSLRKQAVRTTTAARQATALHCVASLSFDDDAGSVDVRDLRGGDAVAALLPSIVRFER